MGAPALCEVDYCTGCGACVAACPIDCISMLEDEEGFLYPEICSEKCIECMKCTQTCPLLHTKEERRFPVNALLWQSHDLDNLRRSSSGGAFFDLAKAFLMERESIRIYGAAFVSNKKVAHVAVNEIEDSALFSGSKYLQSETYSVYSSIREDLKNGAWIVYSGTPCQIAGLNSFLGHSYERLLCIELICHGVGSPAFFSRYVDYLEHAHKDKITCFSFADKSRGWLARRVTAKFNQVRSYSRIAITYDDIFMTAFLRHLILRPSCFNCPYAQRSRQGDLVVGDAWGVERKKSPSYYFGGISLVLPISKKGQSVIDAANAHGLARMEKCDFEYYSNHNPQLIHPVEKPKERDKWLKDVLSSSHAFTLLVSDARLYRPKWRRVLSEVKARLTCMSGARSEEGCKK